MRTFILAALVAATALPASAATLGDLFTGYYSLGDSLADPGNLYAATGGAFPPPPYVDGHISNGPTFAEYLAADFAPGDVTNYATAYARAVDPGYPVPSAPVPVQPLIAHLPQQLAAFSTDAAGGGATGALVTVLFGANDLFNIPLELPPVAQIPAIFGAAQAVVGAVQTIAGFGPAQVLVSNLPDLGRLPASLAAGPVAEALATAATDLFNSVLAAGLAGIVAPAGTDVTLFDLNAAFGDLLDNPASAGFANVTIPCFVVDAGPACTGFLFADGVHPTTAGHALIAAAIRDELAPVPLPATLPLLVVALGAMGLGRRRAA